ncbi:hypothetical protein BZA05DRAFT_438439 [Tricharina praecox]|uniref:uncharacterized protein n=1 Tax=Tricharina praecox TaxID=43433 RepID=UPI0022210AE1|nr:uncharacterized protein BZA05DRAFT_438439 [Tricharina praecox]KAI5845948.1 hypothetical protein BZA05DRAFT_438439 [Tricharina praecox]
MAAKLLRRLLSLSIFLLILGSFFFCFTLADQIVPRADSPHVPVTTHLPSFHGYPFPKSRHGSDVKQKTPPFPINQIVLYVCGVIFVTSGIVLRFVSYRGDQEDDVEVLRSRKIGDWAVCIAFVLYLTVTGLQFFLLTEGYKLADRIDPVYGAHFGVSVDVRVRKGKILYVSRILYSVVVYATKIPYLAHYSSVRHVSNPRYNYLLRVLGVATLVGFFVAIFTSMFTCGRPSNSWALGRYEMCNPFLNIWILMANSILNLSTQTLILLYPLQTAVDMQSSSILLRTKALFIFFLYGMWPLVTGYVRVFIILFYIDVNTGAPLTSPTSLTAMATESDMAALIVTASIPQYRILWRKVTTADGILTIWWYWCFSIDRRWRKVLLCGQQPTRRIHPPWIRKKKAKKNLRPGAFNLDLGSFEFNYPAGTVRGSVENVAATATATGSSDVAAAPAASAAAAAFASPMTTSESGAAWSQPAEAFELSDLGTGVDATGGNYGTRNRSSYSNATGGLHHRNRSIAGSSTITRTTAETSAGTISAPFLR